ncbi:MAG TPA: DUF2726 domain-containing protein [Bauldia sp.]|nr:DUF2726 domain-containing protein [Bauldia sp.]
MPAAASFMTWIVTSASWVLMALGLYHLYYRLTQELRGYRFARRNIADPGNQLRYVEAAQFTKKKVMSPAEYRVFRAVEAEVASGGQRRRVFAQTSLGEILASPSEHAYRSINSKRADIVIIAPDGKALVAIEYQGKGHFQGRAAGRDAVKREALRRAGIGYVEVSDAHSEEEIRSLVRKALAGTNDISGPERVEMTVGAERHAS